jgi:hypothetical protein
MFRSLPEFGTLPTITQAVAFESPSQQLLAGETAPSSLTIMANQWFENRDYPIPARGSIDNAGASGYHISTSLVKLQTRHWTENLIILSYLSATGLYLR